MRFQRTSSRRGPRVDTHPGVRVSVPSLVRLRGQASGLGLSHQGKVRSAQAGGYTSPYRGRGIDFEETRIYQSGDDIRSIDWRVTARTGRPHTKLYREERERPVLLLVDLGPSMSFGTRVAFKSVVAARAAALLAWAAVDNGDRVGGLIFSGARHLELRPTARRRGALLLVQALANAQDDADKTQAIDTALGAALRRLACIVKPGSLLFLLSDFRGLDREGEHYLARFARHNDVVTVLIHDPLETDFPARGRFDVTDGRAVATLDTRAAGVADAFRQRFKTHREALRDLNRRHGAHFLTLATDEPLVDALRAGLRARHGAARTEGLVS